jgi:NADH-quinone oxidoreductase subunit F
MKKIKSVSDLEKLRKEILSKRDPKKPCITICSGTVVPMPAKKLAVPFKERLKNKKWM